MLPSVATLSPKCSLCLGSTQACISICLTSGLATPNCHTNSKANLSAAAECTTASNLRLCAANCTATSVLHDASQPRSDKAGGLQRSQCASLHRHRPHLRTTSCEGELAAQMHRCLQLPVLLCCTPLISNARFGSASLCVVGFCAGLNFCPYTALQGFTSGPATPATPVAYSSPAAPPPAYAPVKLSTPTPSLFGTGLSIVAPSPAPYVGGYGAATPARPYYG